MTATTIATFLALASALGFAFSTSLQHSAAGNSTATTVRGLIHDLIRTPTWLAATGLALLAQLMQAAALYFGSLTLVGPLMISSVVLAVIIRAWLDDRFPSHEEFAAVLLVAAGIAVLLASASLGGGQQSDASRVVVLIVVAVVVGMAGHLVARHSSPVSAAVALATSGGVLFGISSGLLKVVSEQFSADGLGGVLTGGVAPAQIAVGLTATTFNQRAYQLAPLSVSMPLLNVVTVLVTLGYGWWVFAEAPISSLGTLGVMLGALVVIGAGLWLIADEYAEAIAEPPRA